MIQHSEPGLTFFLRCWLSFPGIWMSSPSPLLSGLHHIYPFLKILLGPVAFLSSQCLRSIYNIWPNIPWNFVPYHSSSFDQFTDSCFHLSLFTYQCEFLYIFCLVCHIAHINVSLHLLCLAVLTSSSTTGNLSWRRDGRGIVLNVVYMSDLPWGITPGIEREVLSLKLELYHQGTQFAWNSCLHSGSAVIFGNRLPHQNYCHWYIWFKEQFHIPKYRLDISTWVTCQLLKSSYPKSESYLAHSHQNSPNHLLF